ncbi:UNVERIFIED_CONTAM: hypothetical protein GTU68_001675 [Idotea baltica]|nr:hypothetical protein [Idotea baltica]
MNLHEYQAKELLARYGCRIQRGIMIDNAEEAEATAKQLTDDTGTSYYVVKAQIHAGGRGKAGGVKVAKNMDELKEFANEILGKTLITPQTGEQDVYYPGDSEVQEFYIGMLMDRASGKNVIIYSTEGGVEIEKVAEETPDLVHKEFIDPRLGLQGFQARKVAFNLGLSGTAFKEMVKFISNLYKAFIGVDAAMVEINPAFKTSDDKIMAVDAKVSIDGNALYRHPEIAEMRDVTEEDPTEVEADKHDLNFVKLDGNVGCMVNGAGLAMATMDIIKLAGGNPANFLDVGGGANAKTVEAGFRIILQDPNVKAIMLNIFGGIVRCDRVANGVVEAYKNIGEINVPIIVRLQGTNAEEGKKIIDDSGLKVHSAILLKEAAALVEELIS